MRFLLDQSSDARLGSFLRQQRHDVTRISQHYPEGLPDVDVLALSVSEQRVLITDDRDFGELVFHLGHAHAGVIYLRLTTTLLSAKIERLTHVLITHEHQLDQFIVVTQNAVRIRR